jgi:hypothetical protein
MLQLQHVPNRELDLSTSISELCRRLEDGVAALLRQESNPRHRVDVLVIAQLVELDRQVAEVPVAQRLIGSQPLVSPKQRFNVIYKRSRKSVMLKG